MIHSVSKRRPAARIFTVFLAAAIILMFVSSDRTSRTVAAEQAVELTYVSDVMVFYGSDYSDAVTQCKNAGYTPVESDLNKTAYENQPSDVRKHEAAEVKAIYGDIGNAVVLGYKTTKQRELAITDLSVLQMGIGYDTYKYEDYLKIHSGKFDSVAKTIVGMRDEFSKNFSRGSPAAKLALQIMNLYKYDEENIGLGDYILSSRCSADKLAYLFAHTNVSIVNTVLGAMTAASADYDSDNGTWADRVSKTGMVKKYEQSQIDKTDIDAYANSADVVIDSLQTFAGNYRNALARENANSEVKDANLGTEDASEMSSKLLEGAAKGEIKEERADLYYLGVYDMLASYDYDDNTTLAQYIVDLGSRDYATGEDKYCIYPLVAAMTHGQVEMLRYNGVGMMTTYLCNTDDILKEFDKYAESITKTISDHLKSGDKSVSVWEGVDKKLFDSSIAVTQQLMLDKSAGNINDDGKKAYGVQSWLTDVHSKISTASAILGSVNAIDTVGSSIEAHSLTSSFTAAACIAYAGSGGALSAVLGCDGWMTVTACSLMGTPSLTMLIVPALADLLSNHLKKDAATYGTIPAFIFDSNNGRSCLYNAAPANNSKPADLNAGMGIPAGKWEWSTAGSLTLTAQDQRPRWNALYYTTDPDAGSPICLDQSGSCFTVQYNDNAVPADKTPLKAFNENTAADINSNVRESGAAGIYLFYTTEDSPARINQPSVSSASEYISKVKLSCAATEAEAKTALTREGYKVIERNLSPDRKNTFTYLGYMTQTGADKAATDIRVAAKTSDATMHYGSASYANAGTMKSGDSLYLSSYTQVGDPLTADYMVVEDVSEAREGYEPISVFGGLPYNFNQVEDFVVNASSAVDYTSLFESGLDAAKEKLGKPVFVFFRPSKTYTKTELEKNGGKPQQYISGISVFECLPHRSSGLARSSWDIRTYSDYLKYYAGIVGAEVFDNSLLDGVRYERSSQQSGQNSDPAEPKSFFLVTKTYNPKRAIYGIRSYTASPDAASLPSSIGSTAGGGYAAAEVMLAATAHPSDADPKVVAAFYGHTASHDYLNFIASMGADSFASQSSGLRMLPEDCEMQGYWNDAAYSKVYTNYKNQLTCDYTYLRCKNIYLEGAVDNKSPLTADDIAFTDTPAEKMSDGKVTALSGNIVETEGFCSIQDAKMPNATSPHDLGFRGKDDSGKQQYIYIRSKPVEKQYIASVSVASLDVKETAWNNEAEMYSKAGYDKCMQQLLKSCTDEILPYNLCVFNTNNLGCFEDVTYSYMTESDLREKLTQEMCNSAYGKKLVPVKTTSVGKGVATSRVSIDSSLSGCMNDNWQNAGYPSGNILNFAYMGVSRTDSASKAVTALLRVKAQAGSTPAQTIYAGGFSYTLCGGKIADAYLGDYYLYQTYDKGAGAPVTAVDFGMLPYMNGAATAQYAEKAGTSASDQTTQTLSGGVSSNYIYCYYNDTAEHIDAVFVGTGDTAFDACSDLLEAGATDAVLYDVRHTAANSSEKKYTFIGYSRSKSAKTADTNGIRDIVFVKMKDGLVSDTVNIGGLAYKAARNGNGAAVPINDSDPTYVYYYTSSADVQRPLINKLCICEHDIVPRANEQWENVLTSDNSRYDLNEGVISFKEGTKFLTDTSAYLFCRRLHNEQIYVKPGAAIVGGHCKESMTCGEMYMEPAS